MCGAQGGGADPASERSVGCRLFEAQVAFARGCELAAKDYDAARLLEDFAGLTHLLPDSLRRLVHPTGARPLLTTVTARRGGNAPLLSLLLGAYTQAEVSRFSDPSQSDFAASGAPLGPAPYRVRLRHAGGPGSVRTDQTCGELMARALAAGLPARQLDVIGYVRGAPAGGRRLTVRVGRVESPLGELLEDTVVLRRELLLDVWRRYGRGAPAPLHFLDSFAGVLVAELRELDPPQPGTERGATLELDGEGRLVQPDGRRYGATTIQGLVLQRTAKELDVTFTPFPEPAAIAAEVHDLAPEWSARVSPALRRKGRWVHTFDVAGLPPWMCTTRPWKVWSVGPVTLGARCPGTPVGGGCVRLLRAASTARKDGGHDCRFTAEFSADASVFPARGAAPLGKALTLRYDLRGFPVEGVGPLSLAVRWPLRLAGGPLLEVPRGPTEPVLGPTEVTWPVPLRLAGSRYQVTPGEPGPRLVPERTHLVCANLRVSAQLGVPRWQNGALAATVSVPRDRYCELQRHGVEQCALQGVATLSVRARAKKAAAAAPVELPLLVARLMTTRACTP